MDVEVDVDIDGYLALKAGYAISEISKSVP